MANAYKVTATGNFGPKQGKLYSATVFPSSLVAAWVLKIQDQNANDFVNMGNQVGATNISPVAPTQVVFTQGLEYTTQLTTVTLSNITEVVLEIG